MDDHELPFDAEEVLVSDVHVVAVPDAVAAAQLQVEKSLQVTTSLSFEFDLYNGHRITVEDLAAFIATSVDV